MATPEKEEPVAQIPEKDVELRNQPAVNEDDPFLVTFSSPNAPKDPKDLSTPVKYLLTLVLSAAGFNRILVSTIMAPALEPIRQDLSMSSAEAAMSMTIYLLATAFGPVVIGPLSEIYGRSVIIHSTNVWFLIWNLVCGFAKTKEVLIASRFLGGFGASAVYALAGGILSDVWRAEERGKSLGWYMLVPLIGAAVGPVLGGIVADRLSWPWVFYTTSILQGVITIFAFIVFRETFAPLILRRHAAKLRHETGNANYHTKEEREHAHISAGQNIIYALTRPIRLVVFHPIIQIAAAVSAFSYGLLYIILTSFAQLYLDLYHVSVETSGLHYLTLALGEIVGSQVAGPLMDWYHRRRKSQLSSEDEDPAPEARIPLVFLPSLLVPVGLVIYGWAAVYRVHWVVVDLGAFITAFGMQIAGMPQQAYLIDAYPEHISSVMAATQFFRSLTAFSFPLFVPSMYSSIGYGWGNTLLAFLALFIGVPAPFALWRYGAKLRGRARSTF
ncbi:major facilitator superfamily protein [Sarocladium implicatum]|nr:major facilitator superfamily protein [Sarocladium implicatum]